MENRCEITNTETLLHVRCSKQKKKEICVADLFSFDAKIQRMANAWFRENLQVKCQYSKIMQGFKEIVCGHFCIAPLQMN